MKVIAPVRCALCRSRLTSRTRWGRDVKWCKKCHITVRYLTSEEIEAMDSAEGVWPYD